VTNVRILVVDDDEFMQRYYRLLLGSAGWRVLRADDGATAWERFAGGQIPADVVITDVRMPGMSGIELCERIRGQSDVPLLVVSQLQGDAQVVAALEAGADDYIVKPINEAILLAKVRRALQRGSRESLGPGQVFACGGLRFDPGAQTLTKDGVPVRLTRTEYQLFEFLAANAGRIVSPSQILQRVWGDGYEGDLDILRAAIVRLRRKIEDDPAAPAYLVTHVGIGYGLRSSSGASAPAA
jgi:DNA-binding response OmpR family regulator